MLPSMRDSRLAFTTPGFMIQGGCGTFDSVGRHQTSRIFRRGVLEPDPPLGGDSPPVVKRKIVPFHDCFGPEAARLTGVCHGAHSREGPVLAILAMLAPKRALRVAPGGSAPLFPSAPRHGAGCSGRDGKTALRPNQKTAVTEVEFHYEALRDETPA